MKKGLYGLKTTVIVNLAFLIITAMLLLGLVVVKVIEKNLVEQNIRQYLLISRMVEAMMRSEPGGVSRGREDGFTIKLTRYLAYLSNYSEYRWLAIVDANGKVVVHSGRYPKKPDLWSDLVRKTIASNSFGMKLDYSLFSPMKTRPPAVTMAAPLHVFSRKYSALVGCGEMESEWHSINRAISLISFYILMNTLILLVFGLYIFHKRVIGPINKMVESVAMIGEGDRLPLFEETRGNELGKLSGAINIMLQRLEENKKELEHTIRSLEDANRSLNKVQKELVHSEKMASVGRLASGVAHEIGNPLGIILGYLEILKSGQVEESEKDDLLERMEKELSRIKAIISRLLDFARPGKSEIVATDINEIISETCFLVNHQCSRKNIALIRNLRAQNNIVCSDPNQLKQVFLNLVFNAIDSIGSGGEIQLVTYNIEKEKSAGKTRIVIEIKDTGRGIPKENLDKIFDPFFTTKDPGKGTGLGLSVSASILKSMEADISVESEEGKGTTVRIVLDNCEYDAYDQLKG